MASSNSIMEIFKAVSETDLALKFDLVTSLMLRSMTVLFQNSLSAHINDQNFLVVKLSTFASYTSVPFPISLMVVLVGIDLDL